MVAVNVNVPPHAVRPAETSRVDLLLIADMVTPGARVLDIGCGDGTLLRLLAAKRGVDGRGIELSQAGVNSCVAQGLAVIQGDADTDLAYYPDHAFDYVVLSQTLQATYSPRQVLEQLLRIGQRAIVSFPNFGHWRVRTQLLFGGKMPRTDNLPDRWYDTPEHPSLHHQGFPRPLPRRRRQGRPGRRAQRLWLEARRLHAVVHAEPVRRAGGVSVVALMRGQALGVTPAGTGTTRRRKPRTSFTGTPA